MPIDDAKEARGFLALTEAPSGDRQEDFRTVDKALHGFQWEESGQLTMNSSGKAGEYWVGPVLERLSLHPGWLPVFREILREPPSPGLNPEGYREEVLSMVTAGLAFPLIPLRRVRVPGPDFGWRKITLRWRKR